MADHIDLAAITTRINEYREATFAERQELAPDLVDLLPALVAAAQWALDAPHHDGCPAAWDGEYPPYGPCTCGRDAALAPFVEDKP